MNLEEAQRRRFVALTILHNRLEAVKLKWGMTIEKTPDSNNEDCTKLTIEANVSNTRFRYFDSFDEAIEAADEIAECYAHIKMLEIQITDQRNKIAEIINKR